MLVRDGLRWCWYRPVTSAAPPVAQPLRRPPPLHPRHSIDRTRRSPALGSTPIARTPNTARERPRRCSARRWRSRLGGAGVDDALRFPPPRAARTSTDPLRR